MAEPEESKSKSSWLIILFFIVVALVFIIPASSCLAQGQQVEKNLRAAYASLHIPEGWTRTQAPYLNSPCPFDVQNNCLDLSVRYAVTENTGMNDLLALSPLLHEDPSYGSSDCKRSPKVIGSDTLCAARGTINHTTAMIYLTYISEDKPLEVHISFRPVHD